MRSLVLPVALALAMSLTGCFGSPDRAGPSDPRVQVALAGESFDPANITTPISDAVVFRNRDVVNHTVTIQAEGGEPGEYLFDVGDPGLGPGNVVQYEFAAPGTYIVFCRYHSQGERGDFDTGMVMRVTVDPATAA